MGNYFTKMTSKVRDDIFSIALPNSGLVFTRYLYIKDEVKMALLLSILNKSDDAIFWAYELYYSGFKVELFDFIWKIYYDFFATLNPSFEAYLLNKGLEPNNDRLVSAIIQDLIIRPFNTDVFFLRNVCSIFEIECKYKGKGKVNNKSNISELIEQFTLWISAGDYKSIAQFILNDNNNNNHNIFLNKDIYGIILDIFENLFCLNVMKKRLLKEFNHTSKDNIVLLAKIMTLFSINNKLVKGKNFYITINPEDIVQYETIDATNELRHYRILQQACICGIDDLKQLSLFKLDRDTNPISNTSEKLFGIYNTNWLYHAAFSPIWFTRIQKYRGYVDYTKQIVEFVDDDLMDMFYKKFGYEPDEQSKLVKEKLMMPIIRNTDWTTFYRTFNKNNLFSMDEDELDELNADKIKY